MMKTILPYAGLPVLVLMLASCGLFTASNRSRSEVVRLADSTASAQGIDLKRFKKNEVRYNAPYQFWQVAYEERGYLLAVGDEVTVLVDDARGNTELLRDTGVRNVVTTEKLEVARKRWIQHRVQMGATPVPLKTAH